MIGDAMEYGNFSFDIAIPLQTYSIVSHSFEVKRNENVNLLIIYPLEPKVEEIIIGEI